MAVKQLTDVRDDILSVLKDKERNLAWLSRKSEIPYGTLYSCFKHRIVRLSQSNLDKINSVLKTDFSL